MEGAEAAHAFVAMSEVAPYDVCMGKYCHDAG